MKNYQLIINIPLEAVDNIDARIKFRKIIEDLKLPNEAKLKLQEILENESPRGLNI